MTSVIIFLQLTEMKKYDLNTCLLNNLLCVDQNETLLGGESEYRRAIEDAAEDEAQEYEIKSNTEENLKCVERALRHVLDNEVLPFLKDYGIIAIEIGDWYHPREYNFECDHIGLTFSLNDDFFGIALTHIQNWLHNDKVRAYYDDNFKSRSGFISLCPESLEELLVDINTTRTYRAVTVYITILLWLEFGNDKLQSELEDNYTSYEVTNAEIAWYEPIKTK